MWTVVFLAALGLTAWGSWGEFQYRERLRLDREARHAAELDAMAAVLWTRRRQFSKPGYQWRQTA